MPSLRRSLIGVVLALTAGQAPAVRTIFPAAIGAVAQPRLVVTTVRAKRGRRDSADAGVLTPVRVSAADAGGATLLSLVDDTLTGTDTPGIIPRAATGSTTAGGGTSYPDQRRGRR